MDINLDRVIKVAGKIPSSESKEFLDLYNNYLKIVEKSPDFHDIDEMAYEYRLAFFRSDLRGMQKAFKWLKELTTDSKANKVLEQWNKTAVDVIKKLN